MMKICKGKEFHQFLLFELLLFLAQIAYLVEIRLNKIGIQIFISLLVDFKI